MDWQQAEAEKLALERGIVGVPQNGWRCSINDAVCKREAQQKARQVAARYPGAEVLGDIDVCTGEFVYRVIMPKQSVVAMQAKLKRRRVYA